MSVFGHLLITEGLKKKKKAAASTLWGVLHTDYVLMAFVPDKSRMSVDERKHSTL